MQAFERLEPFGALADEFRFGQIAATVANVHRGKDGEVYGPDFFMPSLRRAMAGNAPVQVKDVEDDDAHAALLDAMLFGRTDG